MDEDDYRRVLRVSERLQSLGVVLASLDPNEPMTLIDIKTLNDTLKLNVVTLDSIVARLENWDRV
jgi:hypothetical protein